MLKKLCFGLVLLFWLFALTGCSGLGSGGLIKSTTEVIHIHVEPPSAVEQIDKQVEDLEGDIIHCQNRRATHRWMTSRQSALYVAFNSKRNSEFEADIEHEIVRHKRAIAALKKQRKSLEDESVGCFLPNALVQMEDGSFKPFIEVIPGDKVMSYDIGHDKQVSRSVVKLYSVESNHLYKINDEFETTGGERLLTQDGWKEINRLKKGDIIHVNGKMVEVFAIELKRTNHTLHNMQVNNTHNFYVSTANGTRYLVHNCGEGGGGK